MIIEVNVIQSQISIRKPTWGKQKWVLWAPSCLKKLSEKEPIITNYEPKTIFFKWSVDLVKCIQ